MTEATQIISSDTIQILQQEEKNIVENRETVESTTVSWKVIDYGGDYFHLYVNLNDDVDYYAGYFFGENFDTYEREDTPEYALTCCASIWTGAGNFFYLYQKSETELAVMHHPYPYRSTPEEWEDYREILTIPVTAGSDIEIGEPILIDESYGWAFEYSFIIYDSFVLGGITKERELHPLTQHSLNEYYMLTGVWGYRLFNDGEYLTTVGFDGFSDEWLNNAEPKKLELIYNGEIFDGLSINNIRPLRFGEKISEDTSIPEYQDYIEEILSENGLQGEAVHINNIFRTDLEGDGVEEVLIIASNLHTKDKVKGQYSIVVLRKIVNGEVKTFYLVKDIKHNLPTDVYDTLSDEYKLCEIVDLNEDDVCEIILKSSFYEGYSYKVYELKDDKFEMVMENGDQV